MPVLWTIGSYVSERGVDEIRSWYEKQSVRCRAKFLLRIRFLAQTPRSEWKREPFDLLHGYELGEIRFNVEGVQHRPLGFFSPGMVFTIVICAEERDGKFDPKRAPEIAESRKREIERDASRCCPFWLPLQ
jgi:hypothetical protein